MTVIDIEVACRLQECEFVDAIDHVISDIVQQENYCVAFSCQTALCTLKPSYEMLVNLGMSRPRCPECGGKIYPDTDRDWGTFGQMCCSACGLDDGNRIDPAFLKLPPQHPGLGSLTAREQMVLSWIMQSGHPFKSISQEIEDACEQLCQFGFAASVMDNGEACYLPMGEIVTH